MNALIAVASFEGQVPASLANLPAVITDNSPLKFVAVGIITPPTEGSPFAFRVCSDERVNKYLSAENLDHVEIGKFSASILQLDCTNSAHSCPFTLSDAGVDLVARELAETGIQFEPSAWECAFNLDDIIVSNSPRTAL